MDIYHNILEEIWTIDDSEPLFPDKITDLTSNPIPNNIPDIIDLTEDGLAFPKPNHQLSFICYIVPILILAII